MQKIQNSTEFHKVEREREKRKEKEAYLCNRERKREKDLRGKWWETRE